jgi:hypothetical protein
MIALSFRAKLLLAMMFLVVGVTTTTLLITESQVRISYERHFLQSFRFQMESFLQQREARLAPIEERVAGAASSPRLIAAMDIAGQSGADPQDIDDLYHNGIDQLREVMEANRQGQTDVQAGLFFFLNNQGVVLYPSKNARLPFFFPGLQQVTQQVERVGQSVSREGL